MNRLKPKTVTYRARCNYRSGKVTWYLTFDMGRAEWHWTKDANRQRSFDDYRDLIDAIVKAGGPDKGGKPAPGGWLDSRRVIIETTTHEEQEFTSRDHSLSLKQSA